MYTVGIIGTAPQEKEFDMNRVSHTCINLSLLLYRHAFLLLCVCFSESFTSQVLDYCPPVDPRFWYPGFLKSSKASVGVLYKLLPWIH